MRQLAERRRQAAAGLGLWSARARQLVKRSVVEHFDDRCPQLAASMSYYALFAVFPITILVVAGFGIVVGTDAARAEVVDLILDNLPVASDTGDEIERALQDVTSSAGAFGLLGIAGLVFSASGLMGAIRNALNAAWDLDDRRPPLQGKLLDILLVLAVGIVVTLSLALSVLQDVLPTPEELLGPLGAAVPGLAVPIVLSFAVFAFLYRVVPATEVRLRDVWPGALVAALLYEAAKAGFSLYLSSFGNYSAVYGSIAAVIVALLFVFIASNLFLLGAEMAAEWPRVRAGLYEAEASDERSLGERLRDLARRLILGGSEPERPHRKRSERSGGP